MRHESKNITKIKQFFYPSIFSSIVLIFLGLYLNFISIKQNLIKKDSLFANSDQCNGVDQISSNIYMPNKR